MSYIVCAYVNINYITYEYKCSMHVNIFIKHKCVFMSTHRKKFPNNTQQCYSCLLSSPLLFMYAGITITFHFSSFTCFYFPSRLHWGRIPLIIQTQDHEAISFGKENALLWVSCSFPFCQQWKTWFRTATSCATLSDLVELESLPEWTLWFCWGWSLDSLTGKVL